mmetsp:Transcript_4998/g.11280  ORF Transcript_4998/g.11280 Transcript_4998/m.11280 type:complete len:273 (-) Transcript_4998:175-993(-)
MISVQWHPSLIVSRRNPLSQPQTRSLSLPLPRSLLCTFDTAGRHLGDADSSLPPSERQQVRVLDERPPPPGTRRRHGRDLDPRPVRREPGQGGFPREVRLVVDDDVERQLARQVGREGVVARHLLVDGGRDGRGGHDPAADGRGRGGRGDGRPSPVPVRPRPAAVAGDHPAVEAGLAEPLPELEAGVPAVRAQDREALVGREDGRVVRALLREGWEGRGEDASGVPHRQRARGEGRRHEDEVVHPPVIRLALPVGEVLQAPRLLLLGPSRGF